jgi:hypothetical protein
LFIYSWEEYTATVNKVTKDGPVDGFTLKVVLGWSIWQTCVISSCRYNMPVNGNGIGELWFNLNELVAPLNITVDSKFRALKFRWNLRLWFCTVFTICSLTMTVVEENGLELPFWTQFLSLSLTAFGVLHMFSLHILELFVQITNLAVDSVISTSSVKAVKKGLFRRRKIFLKNFGRWKIW